MTNRRNKKYTYRNHVFNITYLHGLRSLASGGTIGTCRLLLVQLPKSKYGAVACVMHILHPEQPSRGEAVEKD